MRDEPRRDLGRGHDREGRVRVATFGIEAVVQVERRIGDRKERWGSPLL